MQKKPFNGFVQNPRKIKGREVGRWVAGKERGALTFFFRKGQRHSEAQEKAETVTKFGEGLTLPCREQNPPGMATREK